MCSFFLCSCSSNSSLSWSLSRICVSKPLLPVPSLEVDAPKLISSDKTVGEGGSHVTGYNVTCEEVTGNDPEVTCFDRKSPGGAIEGL